MLEADVKSRIESLHGALSEVKNEKKGLRSEISELRLSLQLLEHEIQSKLLLVTIEIPSISPLSPIHCWDIELNSLKRSSIHLFSDFSEIAQSLSSISSAISGLESSLTR